MNEDAGDVVDDDDDVVVVKRELLLPLAKFSIEKCNLLGALKLEITEEKEKEELSAI